MPAAKFQPHRHAGVTLHRGRLIDALREHVDHKLQLVVAPAGFGKTTLLADFVADDSFTTCWATLDQADRDPAAFLETVVRAIARRYPGFGARTPALLHGGRDVERRTSALVRALVREVEEHIDGLAVLVLDDYHTVNDSAPVTALMDELLRLLPDTLRIVLAGRALPGLTVSRLIVEGQLFGLGEADLKFTAEELLTLLRRRHGDAITAEQVSMLAEGAEGWIAGFLLSVPRLWDGLVSGMIATGGGEGPLYNYLAAEAFDRQPPATQQFLLATSVPETPDLDLCAALLGRGDWRSMLDEVEAGGLFVTRLRGGRGAFRYHQLFRGFLQTRLRRTDAREYARLHALAAEHLAGHDTWPAALAHYHEAGQDAAAAALVARIAPELERAGRWRTLADALAAIPVEAAAHQPALLLAGARAGLMTGNLAGAQQSAEAARAAGTRAGDRTLEAWGLALLGNVQRLQGRTRESLETLRRALVLAPRDDDLVATVRRDLGQCLGVQGNFVAAAAELREALAYFDRAGMAYDAARAEFGLGVALARSGRLAEAIARYESNLDRWRQLDDTAMEAEMLNNLGCAYSYRGEAGRARETLEQGLARARAGGYPRTEGATLHSLGDVLLAGGEVAAARTAFEQGLAIEQELGELWHMVYCYEGLSLTCLLEGDLVRAEEHAHHAIALAQRQESRYQEAFCTLALGAAQLCAGRETALETFAAAAETLTGLGAQREMVKARAWLALAWDAAGDAETAHAGLRDALALAAELGSDGLLDLVVRWRPEFFVRAAESGIEPDRLRVILERVQAPLPGAAMPVAPASLPGLAARAFGPGAVVVDGVRAVAWPYDKVRELFFLLLHGGPRRREQVTATLWPDASAVKAKALLHTTVYRLRIATHREAIIFRGGIYRINDELVTSYDVREFDQLLRAAGKASGDAAVSLTQQAVDLYAGAFLADLEAEWAEEEREPLRRRYEGALEKLADVYAAAGRPRESIAAVERLLALDPLREDLHARVIRAHLRLGDRAAALRRFEQATVLLREELGVPPGPELKALGRRLV